jgi:hypothetical protein
VTKSLQPVTNQNGLFRLEDCGEDAIGHEAIKFGSECSSQYAFLLLFSLSSSSQRCKSFNSCSK